MTTTVHSRGPSIAAMFAALDAGDAEAAFGNFAEDITLTFGNAPAAHGKAEVAVALGELVGKLSAIRHDITGLWDFPGKPNVVVAEMKVTYSTPDGRETTVPCCNVLELRDRQVTGFRIYTDLGPVFPQ